MCDGKSKIQHAGRSLHRRVMICFCLRRDFFFVFPVSLVWLARRARLGSACRLETGLKNRKHVLFFSRKPLTVLKAHQSNASFDVGWWYAYELPPSTWFRRLPADGGVTWSVTDVVDVAPQQEERKDFWPVCLGHVHVATRYESKSQQLRKHAILLFVFCPTDNTRSAFRTICRQHQL